ncbi:DNA polymerase IV [Fervidibacillus halotolerans]|uniref:DNA polymerase IV n=1 Tax=Fervidibacillus halotolerans TaxID=2980027 RepID=A0A9E8S070_9BACI|nr:DNA polymerase IV [Fervidibacillus halotolerans]WAA13919.1 DNA polymerase IV [Fervidibacillus halotolerans]
MKTKQERKPRIIFHVDMNSFYASVEMAKNPELKGKPLAICGNPEQRKGIIVTCSYEARKYGVKTTMPLWEAKRICPKLIVRRPNFDLYRKTSRQMFDLLREYTPMVEPVSIDEGYMDVTEQSIHPLQLAKIIQSRLLHDLDLPSSIGIAPNKFLAKTASNMKKPMGITLLRKREIPTKLWPLPIEQMHGIGMKTAEKLRTIGVFTIKDLAQANDIQLKSLLGINGIRLKERANGIDPRIVDPDSIYDYKSVGNSTTLREDTTSEEELLSTLRMLADKVSARLKNKSVFASSLSVMIRYHDWKTHTRSKKLENPTQNREEIFQEAKKLFTKHWTKKPVRLLGITGNELVDQGHAYKQLDLFSYEKDAEEEPLLQTLEQLKEKFGENAIQKGITGQKKDNLANTSFSKDFLLDSVKRERD